MQEYDYSHIIKLIYEYILVLYILNDIMGFKKYRFSIWVTIKKYLESLYVGHKLIS